MHNRRLLVNRIRRIVRNPNLLTGSFAKVIGQYIGNRNYKRFIILTRSRTGSTMLVDMLNSHPEIYAENELFYEIEDRSIETVLAGIYGTYFQIIKAVGFKIFYYHPLDDNSQIVWDYLRQMDDLHVIHLQRKNVLRTLLSRQIATATNTWGITTDKDRSTIEDRRMQLDPETLREQFEQTHNWQVEFDALFSSHPKITLIYEDIVADSDAEFKKVTEFLELPFVKPKIGLKRQNPEPLSDLIANYEELKSYFADTPWKVYFEE